MQWDESMSVHVDALDVQHQQLISLINEAYDALQRHDEHHMTTLISKMTDYAHMHFAVEENLLKKHGYQDLEGHRFQHSQFIQDVTNFRKSQFDRTNLSQIFVYLSRWLKAHILEEDRKYIPYMPQPKTESEIGDDDSE